MPRSACRRGDGVGACAATAADGRPSPHDALALYEEEDLVRLAARRREQRCARFEFHRRQLVARLVDVLQRHVNEERVHAEVHQAVLLAQPQHALQCRLKVCIRQRQQHRAAAADDHVCVRRNAAAEDERLAAAVKLLQRRHHVRAAAAAAGAAASVRSGSGMPAAAPRGTARRRVVRTGGGRLHARADLQRIVVVRTRDAYLQRSTQQEKDLCERHSTRHDRLVPHAHFRCQQPRKLQLHTFRPGAKKGPLAHVGGHKPDFLFCTFC
mmetsp:Transcript_35938/g.106225  ORF Transcript_35938/g.106225 Transcript_35938/m.106225 type:complete len:268 (-) Transcript_35938:778-1581(-)